MSPARTHLHSVGIRAGADDTTDASAGRAMTSGEEQASKSMAFVEEGNTTAMASPKDNRRLPVRIHDADAQANQTSTDANTVAATAVARPAAAEGNNAPKGMSHTGSAGKISESRERRRGQRTTRFSPLFYKIPSHAGYAPDLIEDA
ncbi:hypothetical protein SLS58_007464 [Diplodia intermedia]|uniref:Uncharacterized protein n=1 Tax=Diplodia intermedia TaxID=856260 RepID=A0ABR3TKD9_9PEZI